MLHRVRYSVEFEIDIVCDQSELDAEIQDIRIPENVHSVYVEDSFTVVSTKRIPVQSPRTLKQWEERYNKRTDIYTTGEGNECRWICDMNEGSARFDLYHLDDWMVSSVTGGSIWLVKRD